MGGCYDRSTSQRINALVVDSARPSLGLLALPVLARLCEAITGRCIRPDRSAVLWIKALREGAAGGPAFRCAVGKEEGAGCRGHFERPTRCAFGRRVGRELEHNVAYAIRPPSADLGGEFGGLLHKSLLCYVASAGVRGRDACRGARVWARVMPHRRNEDAA